jgi:hypothetical protein
MIKVGEFISEVRNTLRSASVDEWIPGKLIHYKGISYSALFLKREADDKRLHKYTNLWTPIKCLEMVEDDLIKCCSEFIPNCTTVSRSKEKLPDIFSTRYGYLIQVFSLDYSKEYTLTSPKQYKNYLKSTFKDPRKRYAWLENGYLIIPDIRVKSVFVNGMFTDKSKALALSCKDEDSEEQTCISLLDEDFVVPEHLIADVKNAVVKELAETYKRIQPDEYQNLNSLEKTNPKDL